MKIFITGGTGFIGRPVVDILARSGHDILILSRAPQKKSGFLKGDLSHLDLIKEKIKKFNPDVILHLAWENVSDYVNPQNSLKNLSNSLNFILFASSLSCKKIVCAGSGLEYGTLKGKVSELTEVQPSNIFEASKVALHVVGRKIAEKSSAQFLWFRIFHSYGPGQRSAALIPYLLRCLKDGSAPDIKNPKAANDYIFVDDVASAIIKIVEKKDLKSNVYNIASGRLTSVGDIANIIYQGKDSLRFSGGGEGRYADISRIKKELRWSPKVDLERGIKKTIAHYKNESSSR